MGSRELSILDVFERAVRENWSTLSVVGALLQLPGEEGRRARSFTLATIADELRTRRRRAARNTERAAASERARIAERSGSE